MGQHRGERGRERELAITGGAARSSGETSEPFWCSTTSSSWPGLQQVVTTLLAQAQQLTVVCTSRRPLHLPQEHEYPVPPLRLPTQGSTAAAQASPAVELFVQRGRQVRPDFQLSPANVADVVAVCRRLDGLPLAIEIAAARLKVLTPHALLARLDQATGPHVGGARRPVAAADPTGHDRLVLRPAHPGAAGVLCQSWRLRRRSRPVRRRRPSSPTTQHRGQVDAFEVIASLADASLVTITDTPDGEPRVGLLESVRDLRRGTGRRRGSSSAGPHAACTALPERRPDGGADAAQGPALGGPRPPRRRAGQPARRPALVPR